jgi:hypothetical protein
MNKIDIRNCYTDLRVLIPCRIDSPERKENTSCITRFLIKAGVGNISILESGIKQEYFPDPDLQFIHAQFNEDHDAAFPKTKLINFLLRNTRASIVAVWDTDVIVAAGQIHESCWAVKKGEAFMSIPYDGRVFVCDKELSDLFRTKPDIRLLEKAAPALPLMYGHLSTGGAFFVNRKDYLEFGGENEKFRGWGPEDIERVKRVEISGRKVHFAAGPMYHLWHPRGKTSRYADRDCEINNRQIFIKTCSNGTSSGR